MVEKGFHKAGYEYIIIDDCWLDHKRSPEGKLQPDPKRFPNGIKALADYVHSKGLKFGIYEDYGNFTCGGYPGILGHLEIDAKTFAEWEVDYIKVDGCYADVEDMNQGYPLFGKYLNATGRPIVYSCSWPDYQLAEGLSPNYKMIAEHCNLWRNFDDIDDSWDSVVSIMDYYGGNSSQAFLQHGGPGNWNDPDMLIIGNFGLSLDQAKAQMAVWSVLAAPLIMSNDMRDIGPEFVDILTNPRIIRINQDPMGYQGRLIYSKNHVYIYRKPILPVSNGAASQALAIVYRGTYGTPTKVSFSAKSLGIENNGATNYEVVDVLANVRIGIFNPDQTVTVKVNPTGVRLLRFNVNPNGFQNGSNDVPPFYQSNLNNISIEDTGLTGWISL